MLVIQKMDAAINLMQSQGYEVIEIDLTSEDYALLMRFAAELDEDGLEQIGLDMKQQTYLGHPIFTDRALPISGILVDDGASVLPGDEVTEQNTRILA